MTTKWAIAYEYALNVFPFRTADHGNFDAKLDVWMKFINEEAP